MFVATRDQYAISNKKEKQNSLFSIKWRCRCRRCHRPLSDYPQFNRDSKQDDFIRSTGQMHIRLKFIFLRLLPRSDRCSLMLKLYFLFPFRFVLLLRLRTSSLCIFIPLILFHRFVCEWVWEFVVCSDKSKYHCDIRWLSFPYKLCSRGLIKFATVYLISIWRLHVVVFARVKWQKWIRFFCCVGSNKDEGAATRRKKHELKCGWAFRMPNAFHIYMQYYHNHYIRLNLVRHFDCEHVWLLLASTRWTRIQ